MRSIKTLYRRALLGGTLALVATATQAGSAATLLCHYKKLGDPTGAATGNIDTGQVLPGNWQHDRLASWSNLFRTPVAPAKLNALCEQHLKGTADFHRLIGMAAAGARGASDYAYPLWHEGDLRPGEPVERIVSFGDSLTDTGNMHTASRQALEFVPKGKTLPSASWFAGRFSNGPTWVEYLAFRNGLALTNWAVGGAQTRDAQFGLIHGIGRQIKSFFEHMDSETDYDPSRTLFTFMVAGNDFVNDSKYATQIVQEQRESLMQLVRHGARKVLVVNLPDVTRAPVFRMGRKDASDVLTRVNVYNSALSSIVSGVIRQAGEEGLTQPGELQIRIVDARSRFDDVLAHPEQYKFSNATDSCLKIDSESALSYIQEQIPRKYCEAGRFVFWDTLHPTTRMHELMSGWAAESAPREWGLR